MNSRISLLAGALAEIGNATAVEALIGTLDDEDNWVRGAVVWALEKIGTLDTLETLFKPLK